MYFSHKRLVTAENPISSLFRTLCNYPRGYFSRAAILTTYTIFSTTLTNQTHQLNFESYRCAFPLAYMSSLSGNLAKEMHLHLMLCVPSYHILSHLIFKEKHDAMLCTLKKNYRLHKNKNINIVSRKKIQHGRNLMKKYWLRARSVACQQWNHSQHLLKAKGSLLFSRFKKKKEKIHKAFRN